MSLTGTALEKVWLSVLRLKGAFDKEEPSRMLALGSWTLVESASLRLYDNLSSCATCRPLLRNDRHAGLGDVQL